MKFTIDFSYNIRYNLNNSYNMSKIMNAIFVEPCYNNGKYWFKEMG